MRYLTGAFVVLLMILGVSSVAMADRRFGIEYYQNCNTVGGINIPVNSVKMIYGDVFWCDTWDGENCLGEYHYMYDFGVCEIYEGVHIFRYQTTNASSCTFNADTSGTDDFEFVPVDTAEGFDCGRYRLFAFYGTLDFSGRVNASNTIIGTVSDDVLVGGDMDDDIDGGGGDDEIYGGPGDDYLYGGWDNDTIYGGDGSDTIDGGEDHNHVAGGNSMSTTCGNISTQIESIYVSSDTIYGPGNAGTAYGCEGNDIIYCGGQQDSGFGCSIYGGDGNDDLYGEDGDDFIFGGNGIDRIAGKYGSDYLFGDAGGDIMWGCDGTKTGTLYLNCFSGCDTHDDADYIDGGADNDTIAGCVGNDVIYGYAGNDIIFGGDYYDEDWAGDAVDGGSHTAHDHCSCNENGYYAYCEQNISGSACP
jgi:Ca2+-binding RTX toxin-like protein